MKLLIIVTLIAIASTTNLRGGQRFLQILADDSMCGSSNGEHSMCGCHSQGCSFDKDKNTCIKIGSATGSTIFTAGILDGCNQATTKASCLKSVAWVNRYGTKAGCSWCSNICVKSGIADGSCDKGVVLGDFEKENPVVTPLPDPTPTEEEKEKDKTKNEVDIRIEAAGGTVPEKTKFAATLLWNNYHDLDLNLKNPNGDFVNWNSKESPDGAKLDIDQNADVNPDDNMGTNTPVENIIYENDEKPLAPGLYTIGIHYFWAFTDYSPETHTEYTLQVKYGDKYHVIKGELIEPETETDNYYLRIDENGKGCFSKTRDSAVCEP